MKRGDLFWGGWLPRGRDDLQAEHERAEVVSRSAQRGQILGPGDKQMAEQRRNQRAVCEKMCEAVMRLDKQINGNGQPGIRQNLQMLADEAHAFFVESKTQKTAEMDFHNKRDQEVKDALAVAAQHMNRWMLAIAMMTLIASILAIFHR
jgi:Flp pilus assembly protein TadG